MRVVHKLIFAASAVISLGALPTSAQSPTVVASSSSQPSDGLSQKDMDKKFLRRYEEQVTEMFTRNLRKRLEAMGKRLPTDFDPGAETFYVVAGDKRLAATRFSVSGIFSSVELLGFSGDQLNRVTCFHQSKDKVPLSYGPCADKIMAVFGTDLNRGFDIEHL